MGTFMGLQVSWCKLEVEIKDPKLITPPPKDAPVRDPPTLVVAGINIHTHINPKVS